MDGTSSGSCPTGESSINVVESSDSATTALDYLVQTVKFAKCHMNNDT